MNNQYYRSKYERKRMMAHQAYKKHITFIICTMICFIGFVELGAAIPEIYQWVDHINPIVQVVALVVPMAIFGLWRLRKML